MINYEDLYFHVITFCSLDVTVNFWANDFQPPPPEKMARTPMGAEAMKCAPTQSRDVGITPTFLFSVKVTLWLPELGFFCKVTTSKFTAKLHHINT